MAFFFDRSEGDLMPSNRAAARSLPLVLLAFQSEQMGQDVAGLRRPDPSRSAMLFRCGDGISFTGRQFTHCYSMNRSHIAFGLDMEVTFSDLSSRKYSKSAPVAASGRHFILPSSPQEYSSTLCLCRPGWTLWTVAQKPERGAQSKDSWSALSQYLDGSTVLISLPSQTTDTTDTMTSALHVL